MNYKTSVSPGVAAFVATMRVRCAQPQGGASHSAAITRVALAWRVNPAHGRLESRPLAASAADPSPYCCPSSRRRLAAA